MDGAIPPRRKVDPKTHTLTWQPVINLQGLRRHRSLKSEVIYWGSFSGELFKHLVLGQDSGAEEMDWDLSLRWVKWYWWVFNDQVWPGASHLTLKTSYAPLLSDCCQSNVPSISCFETDFGLMKTPCTLGDTYWNSWTVCVHCNALFMKPIHKAQCIPHMGQGHYEVKYGKPAQMSLCWIGSPVLHHLHTPAQGPVTVSSQWYPRLHTVILCS